MSVPKANEKHILLKVFREEVYVYPNTIIRTIISIRAVRRIFLHKVSTPGSKVDCEKIAVKINIGIHLPAPECRYILSLCDTNYIRPDSYSGWPEIVPYGIRAMSG